MKTKNLFLLLLPAFFLLLGSGCSREADREKVNSILSDTLYPERAENVEIRYQDSGVLKAIIYAPIMERFNSKRKPYTLMKQGVKGSFYGADGTVENSLKANHAISYEKEKIIEVKENVQLTNNKGDQLNTEKLTWNQNTQKIYSDQFVKITTADKIIYGTGFESDQSFSHYKIFKVKGTVNLKDDAESN